MSDTTPEVVTIGHITISAKPFDRIDAECSICKGGIDVGPSFGIIPGDVMLAEWIKQHAHKPKAKRGVKR